MPSTRFMFSTTKTLPGQTIQLRHKGLWLAKNASGDITKQVMWARTLLTTTIAALSSGLNSTDKAHAKTYFMTPDGGPSPGDCTVIQTKLQQISQGLSTDLTLKLGGDGAHGFVVQRGNTFGALHVSKNTLMRGDELGVITLMHEASHKFAATEDGDGGAGGGDSEEAGYRKANDTGWWRDGLTPQLAINNADSYAYFAYRVGTDRGVRRP